MFLNMSSAPGSWFLSGWYLRASFLKQMLVLVPDSKGMPPPVRLLDLLLGGPGTEAQELVVVLLVRHCYSNILWNKLILWQISSLIHHSSPCLDQFSIHCDLSPALTGWCRAPHWLAADAGVTPLCLCHRWPDHEHPELVPSVAQLSSARVWLSPLLRDISSALIAHRDVTRGAPG